MENVQTNVGVEEADTAEDKNRDKVACTSDGALKAADCATAFADSVMSAVKSAGTDKGKALLSNVDGQAHVCKHTRGRSAMCRHAASRR